MYLFLGGFIAACVVSLLLELRKLDKFLDGMANGPHTDLETAIAKMGDPIPTETKGKKTVLRRVK